VSFAGDELAKGEVYYNSRMTKASLEELSGISVFHKDEKGNLFHTYCSYGRGNEEVIGAYEAGGSVGVADRSISVEKTGSCCHSAKDPS
jgi:hypothetical protein